MPGNIINCIELLTRIKGSGPGHTCNLLPNAINLSRVMFHSDNSALWRVMPAMTLSPVCRIVHPSISHEHDPSSGCGGVIRLWPADCNCWWIESLIFCQIGCPGSPWIVSRKDNIWCCKCAWNASVQEVWYLYEPITGSSNSEDDVGS